MTTWKPIPCHEGYEASDDGQIRSVDRVVIKKNKWGSEGPARYSGRILKPWATKDGYLQVELQNGKKQCVHRLVAMAFVDGSDDGLTVNHKDGNKSNNQPSNLEWVTFYENTMHAYRYLQVMTKPEIKIAISKDDEYMEFCSISEAAFFLGVSKQAVSSASLRNGTCKKYKISRIDQII